jgi:hypothetical protein
MDAVARESHGLALALAGRCPCCAELSPRLGVLARTPCERCGGSLARVELADELYDVYAAQSAERLGLSLVALGLVGLVVGFVPLLGALLVAIGFGVFQLRVVRPALSLCGRSRRLVARWTLRLFASSVGVVTAVGVTLASALGLGGWVTAVAAPLGLGGAWIASRGYLLWQLRRERRGQRVAPIEWLLLVAALTLMVLAATAVVAATVLGIELFTRAAAEVGRWL